MTISLAQSELLQELFNENTPLNERITKVKNSLPALSITCCDAGDIDTETPWLETAECTVYLVDTATHCVRITTNTETATGLVVAKK